MGLVFKLPFANIVVEAGCLKLEMRLEDVEVAVQVVVAHRNPHAGHLFAVGTDCHSAHQTFFAESAVMVVQQQQA